MKYLTEMDTSACSTSTSDESISNEEAGTSSSFDRSDQCAPSSSGESNKAVVVVNNGLLNERVQPAVRQYSFRRRLHHCIAALQNRRVNRPHQHGVDLLARRQRNPERDLLLDYRRELRRLWIYLDAIAVIRLSRVPPGG